MLVPCPGLINVFYKKNKYNFLEIDQPVLLSKIGYVIKYFWTYLVVPMNEWINEPHCALSFFIVCKNFNKFKSFKSCKKKLILK